MSWSDTMRAAATLLAKILPAVVLAGLTAGCFQPLYGSLQNGSPQNASQAGIGDKLSSIEVAKIGGRIGVNVRNDLIYALTGGGAAAATHYRLDVRLAANNTQVIVDITTARPEFQTYGIDASYTLTDITNGKTVLTGQTFARVSYNVPGQQQRFAGARGQRDAEDRAAEVIVENIRTRLASHFAAGT